MTWSSAPASSTDGADAFDADFASGDRLHNDEQIRRIVQARQWGPDRQHCRTLTLPGVTRVAAIQVGHLQWLTDSD